MPIDKTNKIYAWNKMLRISDMKYPVYFSDFLKEHTNTSIGDFVWEYEFADIWGYFLVHDTPQPEGDVVIEGFPEYNEEEGLWYQTWTVRDFTEEEIAANLVTAKNQFQSDASFIYSNEIISGIRVDGEMYRGDNQELYNLIALRELALAKPDSTILLNKADGSVVDFSAAEALDKIGDILAQAGQAQQNLLKYIRTVYAADTIESIPAIPDTFLGE